MVMREVSFFVCFFSVFFLSFDVLVVGRKKIDQLLLHVMQITVL